MAEEIEKNRERGNNKHLYGSRKSRVTAVHLENNTITNK